MTVNRRLVPRMMEVIIELDCGDETQNILEFIFKPLEFYGMQIMSQ